jgi:hypothetical protein
MPGQLGIVIKPQAGNNGIHAGENLQTNLVLEQTVSAIAGRTYNFSGYTYWGGDGVPGTFDGYSGGVDTLHSGSPSDPTPEDPDDPPSAPSPTVSTFEVAFFNASDVPVGSPTVFDLSTVVQNNATWTQAIVPGAVAPAGASKVRVRAAFSNIVENFGFQDVLIDQFSLRDSVVPGLERLTNPSINTPGEPAGWTLIEGPDAQGGTADSSSFIGFAQNPNTTGAQGLWLRPFVNTTQFEPDIPTVFATLTQIAPATAGEDYSFSTATAWEGGFSGGFGPVGGTEVELKMEFLDSSNGVIGSPVVLDLYTAGMRADDDGGNVEPEDWQQFATPMTTAPAGTVNVRVTLDAQGMFNSFSEGPQSAFFDDFMLITSAVAGLPGDFNDDGKVDAADYVTYRKNEGTTNPLPNDNGIGGTVGAAHYNLWTANFGEMAPGSGGGAGAAVPEPSSIVLLVGVSLGIVGLGRRRGR